MHKRVVMTVALLALTWGAAGCGELVEAQLCREASDKICDKWFSCWPVVSTGIWITRDNCFVEMRDWCDHSEAWTGCDVDNQMLRECNNGINSSPCGSLPPACNNLLNCYKANP